MNQLITNENYFKRVFGILKLEHYSSIEYQTLHTIMSDHFQKYKKQPNPREIALGIRALKNEELMKDTASEFKEVLGLPKEVFNDDFLDDNTESYLKNKEFKNALIKGSKLLGGDDFEEVFCDFQDALKININSDTGLEYSDVESRLEYYQSKLNGIPTGIPSLDRVLGGGFMKKTLNIIAAASHVGKSLLGSCIAGNMMVHGKNVLIITLEMSDFEYFKRVDSHVLDLPINELRQIDPSVIKGKFDKIKGDIGRCFAKEYPSGSFSSLQLEALLDKLRNKQDFIPDGIIVDYLGLMKSDSIKDIGNTNTYYSSIAVDLRAVGQKHNLPIMSFMQLNRQGIGNTDVDESLVADAKGVFDASDTFTFLMNNPEMKERGELLARTGKNRNTGQTGEKMLWSVNYLKMRIEDADENSGCAGDEQFQELQKQFKGSPDPIKSLPVKDDTDMAGPEDFFADVNWG